MRGCVAPAVLVVVDDDVFSAALMFAGTPRGRTGVGDGFRVGRTGVARGLGDVPRLPVLGVGEGRRTTGEDWRETVFGGVWG